MTVTARGAAPGGRAPVRVLVVDDQAPFRVAARAVLRRSSTFQVVAEAGTGEEAVDLAATVRPALVLMDVHLPGISGVEAARRILALAPGTLVVLCSTYAPSDLPERWRTAPSDPEVPEGPEGPDEQLGPVPYLPKERLAAAALETLWERHVARSVPVTGAAGSVAREDCPRA